MYGPKQLSSLYIVHIMYTVHCTQLHPSKLARFAHCKTCPFLWNHEVKWTESLCMLLRVESDVWRAWHGMAWHGMQGLANMCKQKQELTWVTAVQKLKLIAPHWSHALSVQWRKLNCNVTFARCCAASPEKNAKCTSFHLTWFTHAI